MLQIDQNNKSLAHELLFVMYFWGFALLRPALQYYSDYSTQILFFYALILVAISAVNLIYNQMMIENSYFLLSGVFFVLLLDLLFRQNGFTMQYFYDFIIFGVVPVHFLSQAKDVKKLLRIYSMFSLVVFLIYCTDPLNDYYIFKDYMTFGFSFALPAYFGLYIGRKFYRYKWMLPVEIACLAELILFANRSAFLSVIVFWLVIHLFYIKHDRRENVTTLALIICAGVTILYLNDIVNWFIWLSDQFGFYSYSLKNAQRYLLQFDLTRLFSGRFEIWQLAQNMIQDNILFGSGTGAFQDRYGFYSHNLYFDLMLQYGLIGLVAFLSLIIKSFYKIATSRDHAMLMGFLFFCLWFPKLLLSLYFFKDIGIWCFLAFGFLRFDSNLSNSKKVRCGANNTQFL